MRVADILIVCALEEEAEEVIKRFEIEAEKTIGGYKCYFAIVRRKDDSVAKKSGPSLLRIVIAKLGNKGNLTSLHATLILMQELSPHYVILTGICGGIINSDMMLGDIVLSNQVIYYEPGKILPNGLDEGREEKLFEPDQKESSFMKTAMGIEGGGWDAQENIGVPWPDKMFW